MLSLTRKTDYALQALTELVHRAPQTVSARDISDEFGLSLSVLTNVLNQLGRAGLVVASRGVKGGYKLRREPARISVADVIRAIEGPFRLTRCCGGEAPTHHVDPCHLADRCRIANPMRRVHAVIGDVLTWVTLEHLADDHVPSVCESLPEILKAMGR